jgi:hypothetical protein
MQLATRASHRHRTSLCTPIKFQIQAPANMPEAFLTRSVLLGRPPLQQLRKVRLRADGPVRRVNGGKTV